MKVPSRRLVVLRHGETQWNTERRRQGQLDSPLTTCGRAQAYRAAQRLQHLGIDAIYTSPLGRAATTASIVADLVAVPLQVTKLAREVDHGAFAGLTNHEIESRHPGLLAHREAHKYTWVFPGGESYADASMRARCLLDELDESRASTPLVVTHEMFARMLVAEICSTPPPQLLAWRLDQGQLWTSWPTAVTGGSVATPG